MNLPVNVHTKGRKMGGNYWTPVIICSLVNISNVNMQNCKYIYIYIYIYIYSNVVAKDAEMK